MTKQTLQTKNLICQVPEAFYREVKTYAAFQGISLKTLITSALQNTIKKQRKKKFNKETLEALASNDYELYESVDDFFTSYEEDKKQGLLDE